MVMQANFFSILLLAGNLCLCARAGVRVCVCVLLVSLKNNHPSLLGNEAEDRHLK